MAFACFSPATLTRKRTKIDDYLKANGYPPSRHGGVSDTSLTWAVEPDYIRPGRIVVGAPVPSAGSPLSLGTIGVEGDPRRSSPDLGKMFLEWKVRNGTAEIRKLVGGTTK